MSVLMTAQYAKIVSFEQHESANKNDFKQIHYLVFIMQTTALYGTWKYLPRLLGFFVTWLIVWFIWNILVICAFQVIIVQLHHLLHLHHRPHRHHLQSS